MASINYHPAAIFVFQNEQLEIKYMTANTADLQHVIYHVESSYHVRGISQKLMSNNIKYIS